MAAVEIEIIGHDKASKTFSEVTKSAGIFKDFLSQAAGVMTGILSSQFISSIISQTKQLSIEALNATASWERLGFSLQAMSAREMRNSNSTLTMAEAFSKSKDKAQDLLKWIQDLAIRSPFSTEDVAQVFRMQMQFGATSDMAKDLTQALLDMASATGASNEQIGAAGYALGQIQNADKLYTQDLRQLMNAGIDVNAILHEMGFSFSDVGEQAISSKDFIAKFVEIARRDFGGMGKEIEGTWAGLMGALGDVKQVGLRELFAGIFEPVKPTVQAFVGWILSDDGLGKLRSIGDSVGKFISPFAELLKSFIMGGPQSGEFAQALNNVLVSLGPLGIVLSAVVPNILKLGSSFIPLLSSFSQFSSVLSNVVALFLSQFLPLLLQLAMSILPPLLTGIMGLANALMPLVSALLPPLMQILGAVVTVFGLFAQLLIESIIPAAIELIQTLMPIVQEILPILADAIVSVIMAMMPLVRQILPLIISLIRLLASVIGPLLTVILPLLVVIFGVVAGAITGVVRVVVELIGKIAGPLSNSFNTIASIINEKVKPAIQAMKDKIEPMIDVFNRVSNAVAGLIEWIGNLASKFMALSVPDLFTPGSPTPFEMGLRGIYNAMKDISRSALPELSVGINRNFGGLQPAMATSPAMGGLTVVVNYQPGVSFADQNEIANKFAPVVYDAVRRLKSERRI